MGAAQKQEIFKRAETYIQEYRNKEKQPVHMKRAARSKGTFYVEPEAKLLFVMRLRGINGMHPKTRHIMQVLRLLQINNGVFMRVNKATMNMLVKVDPYIMYGYPNLKTVLAARFFVSPAKAAQHCACHFLCEPLKAALHLLFEFDICSCVCVLLSRACDPCHASTKGRSNSW